MIWAFLPRGRVAHLVPFPGNRRTACGVAYAGNTRVTADMKQCKACMRKALEAANAPRIW